MQLAQNLGKSVTSKRDQVIQSQPDNAQLPRQVNIDPLILFQDNAFIWMLRCRRDSSLLRMYRAMDLAG